VTTCASLIANDAPFESKFRRCAFQKQQGCCTQNAALPAASWGNDVLSVHCFDCDDGNIRNTITVSVE